MAELNIVELRAVMEKLSDLLAKDGSLLEIPSVHWPHVRHELVAESLNALPFILGAMKNLLDDRERNGKALEEFGEHYGSCSARLTMGEDCDCGLQRALKGFGAGC